jgi:hypothetical protein
MDVSKNPKFHPNCGVTQKFSCLHISKYAALQKFIRALHLGEL